ncbi:hypothetical protein [Selenomonas sp.]|uniref:hypothetical protein n=1 Tax=Selenomonas sp. TaxID=2053611 RepID=UPI002A758414|nr:hypothetical protein [Selenomonas sp.]MDY3298261.1 hypothetical protein [Selenomonas sp.]MDY4415487.1 hypothetical protein [Selenomonas sp.]
MKITADLIVAFGLVAALILNIVLGGEAQITMNISTGLVGWLGKIMFAPSAKTDDQKPTVKSPTPQQKE